MVELETPNSLASSWLDFESSWFCCCCSDVAGDIAGVMPLASLDANRRELEKSSASFSCLLLAASLAASLLKSVAPLLSFYTACQT